jgi:hypothetical protein
MNSRDCQGFFLIDSFNPTVRDGRPNDIHVQHAGKFDVITILTLSLNKSGIFFPKTRITHPLKIRFTLFGRLYWCVHSSSGSGCR